MALKTSAGGWQLQMSCIIQLIISASAPPIWSPLALDPVAVKVKGRELIVAIPTTYCDLTLLHEIYNYFKVSNVLTEVKLNSILSEGKDCAGCAAKLFLAFRRNDNCLQHLCAGCGERKSVGLKRVIRLYSAPWFDSINKPRVFSVTDAA